MHFDSERFERLGERSAAMHDGDFHIKGGLIAVPKHVQKRGLRPAEIEMIDDMKNADHRGKPARKASTFALLSCHSRTKRAHSSCAAASRFRFPSIPTASRTRRSKSPDAQRPA